VVSLPAGVFNPYSGVKTSILFMDKSLAKKAHDMLFVKVENDGYDLGAQRRPIDKNDLPEAARQIKAYFDAVKTGAVRDMENPAGALVVAREKVNESADWNLNGELYREVEDIRQSDWPVVALGDVATVNAGNSAPQDKNLFQNGTHPFCRTADVGKVHISPNLTKISDRLNEQGISGLRLFKKGTILFPKSGASTFLNHRVMLGRDSYVSSHLATINANKQKIDEQFLFYLLCEVDAKNITAEQNYPSLRLSEIKNIRIPLPPLEIQREIVAEISGYQKIINGARQVVENYTPRISIEAEYGDKESTQYWKMVKLGEVAEYINGKAFKPADWEKSGLPIVRIQNLNNASAPYNYYSGSVPSKHLIENGDLLVSWSASLDAFIWDQGDAILNQHIFKVVEDDSVISRKFLYFSIKNVMKVIKSKIHGSTMQHITKPIFESIKILLPPPAEQERLVAEIEEEQKLIAANQTLIHTFEQKIKTKIAAVWGEQ